MSYMSSCPRRHHPGAAQSPYLVPVVPDCLRMTRTTDMQSMQSRGHSFHYVRLRISLFEFDFTIRSIWNRSDWPRKPFAKRPALKGLQVRILSVPITSYAGLIVGFSTRWKIRPQSAGFTHQKHERAWHFALEKSLEFCHSHVVVK